MLPLAVTNPDEGGVSMFEPMGGSAPKYTGTNKINPIAAINAWRCFYSTLVSPNQLLELTRL